MDEFGKYTPEEAIQEAHDIKKELNDEFIVRQDTYMPSEYSKAERIVELKKSLTPEQLDEYEKMRSNLMYGWGDKKHSALEHSQLPEELRGYVAAEEIFRDLKHIGQLDVDRISDWLEKGYLSKEQLQSALISGSIASIKEHPFARRYASFVEETSQWVDLLAIPEYRALAEEVIVHELKPDSFEMGYVNDIQQYLVQLGVVEEFKDSPRVREAAIKNYRKALDESIDSFASASYGKPVSWDELVKELFYLTDEQLQETQIGEVAKWLKLGNDHRAYDCIERTKLAKETLLASEVFIDASRRFILEMFKRDQDSESQHGAYDAMEFVDHFKFNADFFADSEIQQGAIAVFLHNIAIGGGNIGTADQIADTFKLPSDFLTSPDAKKAATEGVTKTIRSKNQNDVEYFQRAIEITKLSPEAFANIVEETLFSMFDSDKGTQNAREFALGLGMTEDQFIKMAKNCLIKSLDEGVIRIALAISKGMEFTEDFNQQAEVRFRVVENFYKRAERGETLDMRRLVEQFHLPEDLNEYDTDMLFNIRRKLDFETISELLDFADHYGGYCRFLSETKKDWLLGLDELNQAEKLKLEPEEIHLLLESGFNIFSEWEESSETGRDGWKQAYEILYEHRGELDWDMRNEIIGRLGEAGEIFGYERMFDYMLNNHQVGRREAFSDFDSIINLYKTSGLNPDEFFDQIFQQAQDDQSQSYSKRSAIRWLKEIAKNINLEQISIKDVPGLADISFLQELFKKIDSVEGSMDVFGSWENLKHFYEIQRLSKNISSKNYTFNEVIEFYKLFNVKPPADLALAHQLFGNFLNEEIYRDFRLLSQGELPELFRGLGVRHTGEAGMSEVRERLSGVRRSFKQPDFHGEGLGNPTISAMFKQFVNYETSSWGSHDDEEFEEVVDYHRALVEKGRWTDVPSGYKPSEVLVVDKIDRVKQLTFDYSEQFVNRFNTLKGSISSAISLTEEPHPLESLAKTGEEIRTKVIAEWSNKLKEMEGSGQNPKAIANLRRNTEALQAIDFRSVKDFEHNYQLLGNFREFHELLRQFTFLLAFRNNRQSIDGARRNLANEMPSIDNVSWTLDFIDHITNQETRDRYFEDDKARRAFLQITNPRALAEELSAAQNQDVVGKMPLQFVPTRGLTLEFSGHIADACWASKLTSIAEEYPNFVSVNIVKNPETANESLAGACLLIRTKSSKGEPLLIIRGLNPNENTINQLSVADFFEKFIAFVRPLAEAEGRKLAIVCDHSGGASTNRPVLFDFINRMNLNKKVRPALDEDTTFNEYDLENITFLLEAEPLEKE